MPRCPQRQTAATHIISGKRSWPNKLRAANTRDAVNSPSSAAYANKAEMATTMGATLMNVMFAAVRMAEDRNTPSSLSRTSLTCSLTGSSQLYILTALSVGHRTHEVSVPRALHCTSKPGIPNCAQRLVFHLDALVRVLGRSTAVGAKLDHDEHLQPAKGKGKAAPEHTSCRRIHDQ